MGNVAFSGLGVTSINGRIGNQTITRNSYGPYVKSQGPGPTAPSTYLDNWRLNWKDVHQEWFLLTDDERDAWIDSAISNNRRQTRKPGNNEKNHILDGFHYFMQTNLNLKLITQPLLTLPPVLVNLPSLSNFNASYSIAFDTVSIAVDITLSPFQNNSLVLYSTFGMSIGRMSNNQRFSFYYFPGFFSGSGTVTDNNIGTWASRFGSVFPSPYKIFFKILAINQTTGQRSVEAYSRVIAT